MELVNGMKKQLAQPEIVFGALDNLGAANEESMSAIAARIFHPNTTIVQVNNTVFLYNEGEKDGEKEAVCYPFNLDTVEQYPKNIIEFLMIIQKRRFHGVTIINKDSNFLRAFLKIVPLVNKRGTRAGIAENPKRKTYIARVVFGKKKIKVGK